MDNQAQTVKKGIILAGGRATRLYPATKDISKLLLPIYDKPAIYYPLSVLMMSGIRDILIISTPDHLSQFVKLLGDGSAVGINITYEIQDKPEGIAQSFTIGADFIGTDGVVLILGDNFFNGGNLEYALWEAFLPREGATIFATSVKNPSDFGVVETDKNGKALTLEEKPMFPKSDYAVPGLYFYDNKVVDIARNLDKSARGEYEITDVNLNYLDTGQLSVVKLDEPCTWFDTGTPDALLAASNYVAEFQSKGEGYIGCIEEVAFHNKYIGDHEMIRLIDSMPETPYRAHLLSCL